ncbi:MAG TPA: hypothetical protein VKT78_00625 [Fimbriimonadaceae bacterium]|nr:hypothetical protein [Fimbriimonadaceae bacterium]
METNGAFFRTLIELDNGDRVYEAVEGKIMCRREGRRQNIELVQQAMLVRGDVAFAPELHAMRPAWAFPCGTEVHRVVVFRNEAESEPINHAAHLVSGEAVNDSTSVVYVG